MERRKFLKNSFAFITPTIIGGNSIHVLTKHPLFNEEGQPCSFCGAMPSEQCKNED